jgi:hypothetical protein
MSNMEMELVREAFAVIAKAKDWLSPEEIVEDLACAPRDVQTAISVLFKGAYVLRQGSAKKWTYKMNPNLTAEQVDALAEASLSADDFLSLSPIPESERQAFKYQRKAELVVLKETVDLAKQRGDIQLENLESLTVASAEAVEKYLDVLSQKDSKLAVLRHMAKGSEYAFWQYAKGLPRNI